MPYTHKKVGSKFVVYKKGKKVGETEGTKTALNKYLAALHIADKKSTKKESKSLKENHEMGQDMGQGHPGCEDAVGKIMVVLKPTPEASPEDLVHPTHAFGMRQFDPMQVHGIYQDEKQAHQVAEAVCNELYESMKALEEKKGMVTTKIEETIKELQKQINQHLEEASMDGGNSDEHHMQAEAKTARIKELREKARMVEASKKPLEEKEK